VKNITKGLGICCLLVAGVLSFSSNASATMVCGPPIVNGAFTCEDTTPRAPGMAAAFVPPSAGQLPAPIARGTATRTGQPAGPVNNAKSDPFKGTGIDKDHPDSHGNYLGKP
jgi:hypothetical protein